MSSPYLVKTGIEEILPMQRTGDPNAHVSVIINDMARRLGHLKGNQDDEVSDERRAYWELGSSFEEGIILGLTAVGRASRLMQSDPDRYVRPGELELDGYIGSPDLLDLLEERVIEIKLTKISSRHDGDSDKFWKWWAQAKTYAHMIGWKSIDLHIGHINADYKGSIDPHYHVWRWDMEPRELTEHWRMVRNHGEYLKQQRAAGVTGVATNPRRRSIVGRPRT